MESSKQYLPEDALKEILIRHNGTMYFYSTPDYDVTVEFYSTPTRMLPFFTINKKEGTCQSTNCIAKNAGQRRRRYYRWRKEIIKNAESAEMN